MQNLKPNHAAVAAKVIDGEAIIMDLTSGAYYSMTGVGAYVWEIIEREQNYAAMLDGILARYNVDVSRARVDLDALIQSLLADGLVIATDDGIESAHLATASGTDVYEPPLLNKYTEMADLLALDPPMPSLAKSPVDA
jgi:hypothetical protein